jgi:hypothetical protein
MYPPIFFSRLFLFLLCLVLFCGCKKTDSSNNNPPGNNPPPAITPIGTAVGNPVSKNIGASGGFIASPDGRLELNIPAGALSSNTDISIQPVTNEAPGGIGLSYHLMPDGITFSKPVTLSFHYTNSDVNGTDPYLLYIAYQDSAFAWKADFKKRDVDTISKTVSLGISHFSIWSMGARLIIVASLNRLHQNQTSALRAVIQSPPDPASGSDDDLPPLPQTTSLPDNIVSNWKVNGEINGNDQIGIISGEGSEVIYKAPSSVAEEKTVQVSAEVKYEIVMYNNGRQVARVDKVILFEELTLLPEEYNYTVSIDFVDSTVATFYGPIYYDGAKFDIKVKFIGDHAIESSVSNVENDSAVVIPTNHVYSTERFIWNTGSYGIINITGITVNTLLSEDSVIEISLIHTGTEYPGLKTTSPNDGTVYNDAPPQPIPGAPLSILLDLKDSLQVDLSQGPKMHIGIIRN